MKDALSWINEVGEAVGQDIFCGNPQKPGSRSEAIVRAIQADALREAVKIASQWPGWGAPDAIESKAKQLEEE